MAKLHKLGERLGTKRMEDKDALDVLRLLRGTATGWMAGRLVALRGDTVAGPATEVAIGHLEEVFVRRGAVGAEMAGRAAAHVEPEAVIRASTELLTAKLLAEVRRRIDGYQSGGGDEEGEARQADGAGASGDAGGHHVQHHPRSPGALHRLPNQPHPCPPEQDHPRKPI